MILKQNSVYQLILPAGPTPREAFAAKELARYLQKSLRMKPGNDGIAFPVTNTDKKGFHPDIWYQFE